MSAIYHFVVPTLDGGEIRLADLEGRVLLLVNTASDCGYTSQYGSLESLHKRYQSKGLTVIGFPCNQFGHQEPGSAENIALFCKRNYGVTFPLSKKIEVNGPHAHPLWLYLQAMKGGLHSWFGSPQIRWNFTKFLVDRHGKVVKRYQPGTAPFKIAPTIERLLR